MKMLCKLTGKTLLDQETKTRKEPVDSVNKWILKKNRGIHTLTEERLERIARKKVAIGKKKHCKNTKKVGRQSYRNRSYGDDEKSRQNTYNKEWRRRRRNFKK